MRVTGGALRGRRLLSPGGLPIRPTLDSVREAIFNIVGQDLSGCQVLDLFAGTGIFGIEALSRGALMAVFIDKSFEAVRLIKRNLEICEITSRASIIRRDLTKGIPPGLNRDNSLFDLVFLDPPYGKGLLKRVLERLSLGGFLAPGALVIAESSKREDIIRPMGRLRLVEARHYGDTLISFYIFEVGDE
jgi:16S rRNA (guanine966-N2)-methyltransferase